MAGIQRMDHFTVVTDWLQLTQDFYEALGLTVGPRPDFGVPGLWLYAGGHAVLHVSTMAQMPAQRRGALDHMAFQGRGHHRHAEVAAQPPHRLPLDSPAPALQQLAGVFR